jgi:hypothetical protein
VSSRVGNFGMSQVAATFALARYGSWCWATAPTLADTVVAASAHGIGWLVRGKDLGGNRFRH